MRARPCSPLTLVTVVAIWLLARRRPFTPAGAPALAAVAALLVFAPVFSPQYVVWLVAWGAIAGRDGRRWSWLASVPVILTGTLVTLWYADVDLGPGGNQLVLGARNLAVMAIVIAYLVRAVRTRARRWLTSSRRTAPGCTPSSMATASRSPCSRTGSPTPATSSPRSPRCCPGTKVRFCFRGHAHSDTPEPGHYRFADFASDVEAVSTAYGATRAVGTSLGAGAITHLLGSDPDRFERVVFLLPAALDVALGEYGRFDDVADLLESLPPDEAIAPHRRRTPDTRPTTTRSRGSASSTCSCGRT